MTKTRPPVLVFGSGLTVLGTIRLLASAGFHPLVVGDNPGAARWSRHYRAAPKSRSGGAPEKDLVGFLGGLPLDYAILMPCSDDWILRVAEVAPRVADRFPASVSSHRTLETLIDKGNLAGLLGSLGLPHPRTLLVQPDTDVRALADADLDGAFIKPRDSSAFFQQFGAKAFRVASRDELITRLADIARRGLTVQLQEYIPGPATNHFYVEGFIDRGGTRRALFVRQRLRMSPPDFGNSTMFESVPPDTVPDAVDTVDRLLTHVNFRGIFSVELKRDQRDGLCRLIEVNARPWWYVEFAGQCGVNVCGMYANDALGEPVPDVTRYRVGKSCVYPYYDYFACKAMHTAGDLSIGHWMSSWMRATQPVLRLSDPLPAVMETARVGSASLTSALSRRRRP